MNREKFRRKMDKRLDLEQTAITKRTFDVYRETIPVQMLHVIEKSPSYFIYNSLFYNYQKLQYLALNVL